MWTQTSSFIFDNLSKDTGLFWLLHKKRGCTVSYDEIKINVWPERILHKSEKPDVRREEINMLVYRLRKKLGKYGQSIVSVPRYGYMLDI
ncbi:helix-turn-helix domain-containing protein [Lysinibacillus fusiformis]|uniref:winged helix-turn-helix domain-containing protein n=1 Tax=Lysinibacillus fusiformis TaxID=28031 RepID=UPI0011A369E4